MNKVHEEIVFYHAQPQTWFCTIKAEFNEYQFVHHSEERMSMKNELEAIFVKAQVPEFFRNRPRSEDRRKAQANAAASNDIVEKDD
ncbi:unnamed protein product, partial [Mesorhabditis belari]|uniref:Uncharacterized protein n=1 Tax=Mesorhabditis belari TaxID=2138241 RepID=A0AAF3F359_9BILA